MSVKRQFDRQQAFIPLSVESDGGEGGLGVTRDASSGGVLFHTRCQLKVGDTVALKFASLVDGEGERQVQGKVVRVEENTSEMGYMWPLLVAVKFDEKTSELQETIDKAQAVTGSVID
jgi:hypothetical protein